MHAILIVGAALVGLPILLHLIMKQEPKRLPFPALRFLKQKNKVNQRKLRLRHFILLALRMLVILLFALALFQPKTGERYQFDTGRVPVLGRVNFEFALPGSQLGVLGRGPVSAVFLIDTSPSMGYTEGGKSRLDEARRRALELLDELPAGSRVAIVDPNDPLSNWEPSLGDARRKLEGLKEPQGSAQPVSQSLPAAYQLFRTLDDESDDGAKLPRLVVVISDRTAASWKVDRPDDLKALAEAVPPPAVAYLFFDVGVDKPANVAILTAEPRPQLAAEGQPVNLAVSVQATGPDVPTAVVRIKLDGVATQDRKEVKLAAGTPTPVTFTFNDLKPGLHQAEVSLETPDALMADNVRYVTFRVGDARKLLTISDDPDDAAFWQLAHKQKGEFACDVATPDKLPDFGLYEIVCLLSVSDPAKPLPGGGTLWQKLRAYVERGGKVLVIPGGLGQVTLAAYDPGSDATAGLLPGKLVRITETPNDKDGAIWDLSDENALRHPLMKPFKEWKLRGNVDFLKNPRRARKYWEIEAPPETAIVRYADNPDAAKRTPAVLEKVFPAGGKVLMLTTRMDSPWDPERQDWHNYWQTAESSWGVVFPSLLAKYLAGDTAEAAFNFTTGQAVAIALPKGDGVKGKKYIFEGPGIAGKDGTPEIGENQTELRLSPLRTTTAGNFVLRTEDRTWQDGFSLNAPPDESNLSKVPVEAIEPITGPNSIVPVTKDAKLRDALNLQMTQDFPLFPLLMICVLLLFAAEGVLSNLFYRLRGKQSPSR